MAYVKIKRSHAARTGRTTQPEAYVSGQRNIVFNLASCKEYFTHYPQLVELMHDDRTSRLQLHWTDKKEGNYTISSSGEHRFATLWCPDVIQRLHLKPKQRYHVRWAVKSMSIELIPIPTD